MVNHIMVKAVIPTVVLMAVIIALCTPALGKVPAVALALLVVPLIIMAIKDGGTPV